MEKSIKSIVDVYMSMSDELSKMKKPFTVIVITKSHVNTITVTENDFLDLILCAETIEFYFNNQYLFSAQDNSDFYISPDMYQIIFDIQKTKV